MSAKIISLPYGNTLERATPDDELDASVLAGDLRRARIRIAQLEASLTEAMRDSLSNFNRARAAERQLAERSG